MSVDYDSIKKENLRKYGEDIGRIGRMLLAERYGDRTHFIFELLQNAEDALKKRGEWGGPRSVKFDLSTSGLVTSHFGKLFDEADVRGVCGIGESTKNLTDIGRFGIGFKSVYAFTDLPEIHSGCEHFAIDSYVWPRSVKERTLEPEETQICVPFLANEPAATKEILKGLRHLGPRTLLFLREIEEISWSVVDGPSGLYLRNKPEVVGNEARKVVLIGQDDENDDFEEQWIVFSREVFYEEVSVGHVEVAFHLELDGENGQSTSVRRAHDTELVAFFPTVLPTYLGFVVQGPYRTTPSRDNVPQNDRWNQYLIQETAILLIDALKGLRQLGLLNVSALQCLPLDPSQFPEGSRFFLLFQAIEESLKAEPLLPAYGGGHIAAQNAKLARTQDLRALIGTEQLAGLFPSLVSPIWLSDKITADRTPTLRNYLTSQLDITEITPEWLVPRLTEEFLVAQPDEWIERLYEFLSAQRGLLPRLRAMPLVRLEDGSHTVAYMGTVPQAYLPGDSPTGFPTVKRGVCESDEAQEFLQSLGLRVPDPVDDVIAHVLPKYDEDHVDVPYDGHQSDIGRILTAFATDSSAQRNRLRAALQEVKFVVAVEKGSNVNQFVRPSEVYLSTERLTELFSGVPGVLLVDNSREYFKGEPIRDLLRAVGTPEYLLPTKVEPSLTSEDKTELRRKYGDESVTYEQSVDDYTLMGLAPLLSVLPTLPADQASRRASLLWQALSDVLRRSESAFYGNYHWFRYADRRMAFPACFVQTLNETAWVPDAGGELQPPRAVVFNDTGWETNPGLAAKILFKPPVIEELAKEAGIEAGALELLKQLGCTSEAELRERLGITDDTSDDAEPNRIDSLEDEDHKDDPTPEKQHVLPNDGNGVTPDGQTKPINPVLDRVNVEPAAERKFISYVEVRSNEYDEDSDGLSYQERMSLEEQAITLILSEEPKLQRTPPNNPGFDLSEPNADGNTVKWIEVKAMKGTLDDHPVGMTNTQFKFAQKHQDAYWLYVVENAGDAEQSRVLRIRNPAGKAQTFTFDRGWASAAENPT